MITELEISSSGSDVSGLQITWPATSLSLIFLSSCFSFLLFSTWDLLSWNIRWVVCGNWWKEERRLQWLAIFYLFHVICLHPFWLQLLLPLWSTSLRPKERKIFSFFLSFFNNFLCHCCDYLFLLLLLLLSVVSSFSCIWFDSSSHIDIFLLYVIRVFFFFLFFCFLLIDAKDSMKQLQIIWSSGELRWKVSMEPVGLQIHLKSLPSWSNVKRWETQTLFAT